MIGSLRLAKMRAKDDPSAICNKLLDGRKRRDYTCVVSDLPVLKRYVEVTAYKNLLALYIDIINLFFVKHLFRPPVIISAQRNI
jgi:hypothetical protein